VSLLSTDSRLFYQKLQEKRIWDIVDDDNRISYPLPSLSGYYQKKLLGKRLGYNKPEIAHRYL